MKLPVASHTFLSAWDNCPWKAYRQYIAKDLPKQPQTHQMRFGNEVHSAFEVRIKHGTSFPAGMEKYEAIAAPLVAAGAVAEKMLGIDDRGALCDFFAPEVWLRGKIDCTICRGDDPGGVRSELRGAGGVAGDNLPPITAAIFDWKTGKKREEKAELLVHAVLLKAWQPTIQKVTAHYVWLQNNEVGRAHDVSDTESTLGSIRITMGRVALAIEEEDFPKRPNPLCGWCPVSDCEFNRSHS